MSSRMHGGALTAGLATVCAVLAFVSAAPAPGGPAVAAQGSTLGGRVTDAATGRPLVGALVVLTPAPSDGDQRFATTDAQGAYRFEGLPVGSYALRASAADYVGRSYGQRHSLDEGVPLVVSADTLRADVNFALRRGGAIAGRVSDVNGAAFVGAEVEALRPQVVDDQRILVPIGGAQTNGDGNFRIDGLPPGAYYVGAFDPGDVDTVDPVDLTAVAHTFYPGVSSASDATRVDVEGGSVVSNIEFGMRSVSHVAVSGRLIGIDAQQLRTASIVLRTDSDDGVGFGVGAAAIVKPDGTFRFLEVPPGRYQLRAQAVSSREERQLFATFRLSVGHLDVENVVMNLGPGARLTGSLQMTPPALRLIDDQRIWVSAPVADGTIGSGVTRAIVARDGTFTLDTPPGGRLVRIEGLPDPWSLERVMYRGQDITDVPLDLEPGGDIRDIRLFLTDRASRLTGMVRSGRGTVVSDYAVVVLPADRRLWRPTSRYVRLVYPDLNGRYEIVGLPTGAYLVATVQDMQEAELYGEATFERLAVGAAAVTVRAGETTTLDLKVTSEVERFAAAARSGAPWPALCCRSSRSAANATVL